MDKPITESSLNIALKRGDGLQMKYFNNMMLIITEACNLRCSYCYEQGKPYSSQNNMSWPTAKKAVDLFFSQVPAKMDRTDITFFGGEPTLAFALIKKVIEYSYPHRTIGGYIGNKHNYIIITNGTILSDEMFELYSKLGKRLNIRVSIDGYKDNHDKTRRTAEGKGSWHLLEKNLLRFKDLKETHGVNVTLISTINKSTCRDIYYNYKNIYNLTGGMQISTVLVHEDKWENEDFKAIKDQAMLLYDYCLQYKVAFPFSNTRSKQSLTKNNNGDVFHSICTSGISSFTVNYAGDFFSCHRAYYYGLGDTFNLGNIDTGFSRDKRAMIYKINNLKMLPLKCQECIPNIRRKCRICIASNKVAYGNSYSVPDGYCLLMKELYQLILGREKQMILSNTESIPNKTGAI